MIYRIQPAGFGWNWCESAHIGVNQKKKKVRISALEERCCKSGAGAAPILPCWCFRVLLL